MRSAVPERGELAEGYDHRGLLEKCGGLTQKSGNARIIVIRRTVQPSTQKMWIHSNQAMRFGSAEI